MALSTSIESLEQPGEFPFTRGAERTGPDTAGWFSTFYSGAGTAEDTNALFRDRFDAATDAPNLLVAMDLPTQIGMDPDHELATGEVGRIGVSISSIRDIDALFDGIGLDRITSGTVGNSIGVYTCPLFELAGRRQGVAPERMRIVLQNDPLKEFTGRGTQIFPIEVAIELATDVVEYVHAIKRLQWKPQYTCATQMRWGGVSAAQEIGFGLAAMLTYTDAAERRGIPPATYLGRTDLHMSADEDLLGEVAKFRAARRAWALVLDERYGRDVARRCPLHITVFTAGNRLTAQRPLNNIVRTTTHVIAAMLGGVDEMLLPGFDEALGLPTREATELTNATKQILHYETGLGCSVDPLGGSEEVERRTSEMVDEALHWLRVIDEAGGMGAAIDRGLVQAAMTDGLHRRQREIEAGERPIVGLNFGNTAAAQSPEVFVASPNSEINQVARVKELRASRSGSAVAASLGGLRDAAKAKRADMTHNVIPAVSECIAAEASVGEIFDVLRDIFGEA